MCDRSPDFRTEPRAQDPPTENRPSIRAAGVWAARIEGFGAEREWSPLRRRPPGQTRAQKVSAEITSPPAFVPKAHQLVWLTLFLMNFTLPSLMSVFTPPEWRLRNVFNPLYWAKL